jgi:hypothetical protein
MVSCYIFAARYCKNILWVLSLIWNGIELLINFWLFGSIRLF